jgi:hypothetical protein
MFEVDLKDRLGIIQNFAQKLPIFFLTELLVRL